MAIEIVHSRTATLIDGSNPDEIQAADWNDNHVITAAANSVLARAAATDGAVSEVALSASQLLGRGATGDVAPISLGSGLSMTGTTLSASGGSGGPVWDAGVLTSSTPYVFRQTWDNAAQDVVFTAVSIRAVVEDETNLHGDPTSRLLSVGGVYAGDTDFEVLAVENNLVRVNTDFAVYNGPSATTASMSFNPNTGFLDFPALGSSPLQLPIINSGIADPLTSSSPATFAQEWDEGTTTFNALAVNVFNTASAADSTIARFQVDGADVLNVGIGGVSERLAQWPDVPTSSEIADGYSQVGVDGNTGTLYLAANVGGTIFKVALT